MLYVCRGLLEKPCQIQHFWGVYTKRKYMTYVQPMFLAFSVCLFPFTLKLSTICSKTGWNFFSLHVPRLCDLYVFCVWVRLHFSFWNGRIGHSLALKFNSAFLRMVVMYARYIYTVTCLCDHLSFEMYILYVPYVLFVHHIIFFVCIVKTYVSFQFAPPLTSTFRRHFQILLVILLGLFAFSHKNSDIIPF